MMPRLLPSRLLPSQLLGTPPTSTAIPLPERVFVLGSPGRPAKERTLLITNSDNSGSVICPQGTDPLSNRFAEVARAFAVVARNSSEHELGAVLHFDVPSSGEVGPLPITRANLARFDAALQIPSDGAGCSLLRPSLRRATQLATQHADHQTTLVVLSDFFLLDDDPAAVLAELAAFPGDVHAVVLGGHDIEVPDERVTVTRIGHDDAPGAVAKALFGSLTKHRPGSAAYRLHHADERPRGGSLRQIPQRPQRKRKNDV